MITHPPNIGKMSEIRKRDEQNYPLGLHLGLHIPSTGPDIVPLRMLFVVISISSHIKNGIFLAPLLAGFLELATKK